MSVKLMMELRNQILALETRLTRRYQLGPADTASFALTLPQPQRLTERAHAISAIFDSGSPAEPPSQARINALARLREGRVHITRKDWSLIAWGLCDNCGRAGLPIEDPTLFEKIMSYVENEIRNGISRKIWFGLLHSYFAYHREPPENSPNWLLLRAKLAASLPDLINSQRRPKAWTRALERQSELLTDHAGSKLGEALFNGDDEITKEVTANLPIPATSWLWRRIISKQLAMLPNISDGRFLTALPALIALAEQHPLQMDNILAAVLTRYYHSEYKTQPHSELKQFALDHWQSPQVKSANRWSLVSSDVHQMMLHWFAKADLEHFFSLLQGEDGVDRARLDYWLRFVDQISYTRIVMGEDAFQNRDSDFSDFRSKNKGRFSQLIGANATNNAFVMRLGEYYFVEFSGTGNACYIYSESQLPFNPEDQYFRLAALKRRGSAVGRIIHNGDWAYSADNMLANLGIRTKKKPSTHVSSNTPTYEHSQIDTSTVGSTQTIRPTPNPVPKMQGIDRAILVGHELAKRLGLAVQDNRSSGGAFWVIENGSSFEVHNKMKNAGYAFKEGRGYWIK